jgi:hypothetical protein
MAAKQGPSVLFLMPNRTKCIPFVSVMETLVNRVPFLYRQRGNQSYLNQGKSRVLSLADGSKPVSPQLLGAGLEGGIGAAQHVRSGIVNGVAAIAGGVRVDHVELAVHERGAGLAWRMDRQVQSPYCSCLHRVQLPFCPLKSF